MKKSGVYKIVNIVTGQEYYGSSVNIHKRKGEHFNRLKAGKHGNQKLQRSFDKYGIASFSFFVVEITSNYINREQYFLDTLNPFFNICKKVNDFTSIPRTKEWSENIAKANRGRKISEETRQRLRDSHLGKIPANKGIPMSYETKRKVSESKKGSIPWNKGVKTGRNEKQIAAIKGIRFSDERKKKHSLSLLGKKSKPVIQLSLDGIVIKEFKSVTDALKECSGAANVLTGLTKTANGYLWVYKKDFYANLRDNE